MFMLWLNLVLGTVLEVVGDIFFKKHWLWSGMFFYTAGTFFWAYALRLGELSKLIVVFSVLNLILAVFAGLLIFNEQLTATQWVGVGLGVASVVLLSF